MVEYCFTLKLPLTVKSLAIYTFPFNDESFVTNNLLLVVVSPVTVNPAPAVKRPLVVMVLFVRVSVPVKVANVPVVVGKVIVPELIMDEIVGVVRVLFVRVSVPVKVANVSVEVGKVIVPELMIDEMVGVVSVLFVKVSVPVKVANVSVEVGKVIVPDPLRIEEADNVPFTDKSLVIKTLPLNEASEPTKSLLLRLAS